MEQVFVRSSIITAAVRTFDSHGDVRTYINMMDWWKEAARKWYADFDKHATNIVLTCIGDNPKSWGTTQVFVLSFMYKDEPVIMQLSRHVEKAL